MEQNYFDKFSRKGIAFMEGTKKADIKSLVGDGVFHISDYGFIDGEEGRYAAFTVRERPGFFYFSSKPVYEVLSDVDTDGMREELFNQPVQFIAGVNKQGREYTAMAFVRA